ncbi:unnamed protein product, partial [marine sediment metagenome]
AATLEITIAAAAECGNETLEAGEICDDGNTITEVSCPFYSHNQETCLACNENCTQELTLISPYCGDGKRQTDYEECDDGNIIENDGCTGCVINSGWICSEDAYGKSICEEETTSLIEICQGTNTYYDTEKDECWVLGELGKNCIDACATLVDFVTGISLSCDSDPNWNDDISCSICNQFNETDMISCENTGNSNLNPLYNSGDPGKGICVQRSDAYPVVSCSETVPPSRRRIC